MRHIQLWNQNKATCTAHRACHYRSVVHAKNNSFTESSFTLTCHLPIHIISRLLVPVFPVRCLIQAVVNSHRLPYSALEILVGVAPSTQQQQLVGEKGTTYHALFFSLSATLCGLAYNFSSDCVSFQLWTQLLVLC